MAGSDQEDALPCDRHCPQLIVLAGRPGIVGIRQRLSQFSKSSSSNRTMNAEAVIAVPTADFRAGKRSVVAA
jgi:hypothetical protein